MAAKSENSVAFWQWKSNNNPWSESELAEWTYFQQLDNEIIEKAYQSKQKKAELDYHYIKFDGNVQISKFDHDKQRPVQRATIDSSVLIPRQRFLISQKPVESFSSEFNHFCLIAAEWLYQNKDKLNVGNSVWVKEAAAGIIEEGNRLVPPRAVTAVNLAGKLLAVKDKDLGEIAKCCIYLYTMETFLCYEVNKALRSGDLSKVGTFGAYCYFLTSVNDTKSLQVKCHTQTVYRCMTLSEDEIDMYKPSVGTYKAWPAFSSTSKNRSQAEGFGPVLFIISFIALSKHGCGIDISSHSSMPWEEEILLPPGTNFRVDKMEHDKGTKKYRFFITVV